MIGGFKKLLGIEGVSIELKLPEVIVYNNKSEVNEVKGLLLITSKSDAVIKSVSFKLVEKYERGRKGSKLINEYTVGYAEMVGPIEIQKGEFIETAFVMPYRLKFSEIDQMGQSNFLMKGVSGLLKLAKGAKSSFRIEAEAYVEGTKLHPLSQKEILIDY